VRSDCVIVTPPPVIRLFADPKVPAGLSNFLPLGQPNLRLPELSDNLLKRMLPLRHPDLLPMVQILASHLDRFSGGQVNFEPASS
jgi:hypothetical protein